MYFDLDGLWSGCTNCETKSVFFYAIHQWPQDTLYLLLFSSVTSFRPCNMLTPRTTLHLVWDPPTGVGRSGLTGDLCGISCWKCCDLDKWLITWWDKTNLTCWRIYNDIKDSLNDVSHCISSLVFICYYSMIWSLTIVLSHKSPVLLYSTNTLSIVNCFRQKRLPGE